MANDHSRRKFIKKLGGSTLFAIAAPTIIAEAANVKDKGVQILKRRSKVPANDRINIASIGLGIMGFGNLKAALSREGIELVSGADCYDGHLQRLKELYGTDIKTTRNYEEILEDPTIDGVIISTPDHWHARQAIAAMKKGKAVYCEKPMVKKIEEGDEIISTQKASKLAFQVGSQWASSIVIQKAKELYETGAIGQLNFVEVYTDRFDAKGAWQYSIPPDASAQTCDWKSFQGGVTNLPFDSTRFFRWRNYQDYGTGMAGDLFVHLFTRLHTITSSFGPERIYATGGLNYWKDGRDVADLMLGLFDYPKTDKHPAFNLSLRVNFVDGSGGGDSMRLVGNEGEMVLNGNSVTIRNKKLPLAPGYGGWDTFGTFPENTQNEFVKAYNEKYKEVKPQVLPVGELVFQAPTGYDMRVDHFDNWFNAIRTNGVANEGPEFAMRTTGPALAANLSYQEKNIIHWDPVKIRRKQSS
ncbi:Gfo/Idh/MocA family protein [Olivibacter domesticus]|uniref:Oxidoreductase family, NAD-binding Rossmann fold n=1 Tax=Olivibacter domesticus TaxID=407022 RepID=A0A1H7T4H7_OLID1|nr:Gfo/Idh/MocA family oxidoreductase [Olivibacter domesticus]SEL79693.1 Oxidoreductase family, NAD-binding Rossmann fold [Olivibacter domesticus]